MTASRGFACPLCGGAVGAPHDSRVLRCGFCGRNLYYGGDDFLPRLVLRPAVSASEIQRRFFAALTSPLLPAGLKASAVVIHRRRHFVPMYLVSGKRGGVLRTVKERLIPALNPESSPLALDGRPLSMGAGAIGGSRQKVEREPDARVVLGDYHYVYSACALEGWEGESAAIEEVAGRHLDEALPAALSGLSKEGEILEANIPLERVLAKGVASFGGIRGVDLLEVTTRLLYVPILEIGFRYRDQIHSLAFEEVEGRLLRGQLPFRREWAFLASLPVAGAAGFLIGKAFRLLFAGGAPPGGGMGEDLGPAAFAGAIALVALFLGIRGLWTILRTPMRVDVMLGGGLRVVEAGAGGAAGGSSLPKAVAMVLEMISTQRRGA